MNDILPWIATAATVTAASMTASNLGSRITGYGFIVFTLGSICWLTIGLTTGQSALLWTNIVLTLLNLFGIWRWLGREARVEKGTEAAHAESQRKAGETLFPVSLLGKAKVVGGDGEIGTCVDAMVGCESGRLVYVGVTAGGVAGVGEVIRRVDWSDARIDGDDLRIALRKDEFDRAEEIEKDRWPAR